MTLSELQCSPFFTAFCLSERESGGWSPAGFKLRHLVVLEIAQAAERVTCLSLTFDRALIAHPDLGPVAVEMAQMFLGPRPPGTLASELKDERPVNKLYGEARLIRTEGHVSLVLPGRTPYQSGSWAKI